MFKLSTLIVLMVSQVMVQGRLYCQTTPPTVSFTTPSGIQRGTRGVLLIEGTGLEGARAIVFSEPGLSGNILEVGQVPESRLALEAKVAVVAKPYFEDPVKMQMRVEVVAESWMATGIHQFRVITPRGSSTVGRVVVSDAPEYAEAEPNNDPSTAQLVTLPTTINGAILSAGDQDLYRFEAEAGQDVVLEMKAPALGSSLDPTLELYDSNGQMLTSNRNDRRADLLGFRIQRSGWYVVKVGDNLASGSLRHFYRLGISTSPFLKGRYPLGIKSGTALPFQVWGFNLGKRTTATPEPFGLASGKIFDVGALVAKTGSGETANALPVAIGPFDEVYESGENDSIERAQTVSLPLTVNGRILSDSAGYGIPDYYRFRGRKGQKIVLEVAAARLGSPLDSLIEVLDANGKLLPRLTARPVWKSQITLFDRDSKSPGLRIAQAGALQLNDFVAAGTELMQVVKLVNGPDEDVIFDNFGGQRLAMEATTPEAHALDDFVYKVELHPPGTQFPPNGMPLFQFYQRNDDGGPGYGKDSHITVTLPADDTYYFRISDVSRQGGEDFAYRLTVREPSPDFLISASPPNLNIPMGASVPVEVTALRQEGFVEPIQVEFDVLPKGVIATSGVIPAGEKSVTLTLSLNPGTVLPGGWGHYRVVARANLNGNGLTHVANGGDLLKLVAISPRPDVKVSVKDPDLTIVSGGRTQVTLVVERFNGFHGRVLFKLQDLPYGVRPIDVGLNGVMIAENETERTFTLECQDFVRPMKRKILAVGVVEALVPTEHPAEPATLEVIAINRAAK